MAVPIFSGGGAASVKGLIWDGDLTAPNPYKIHANTAQKLNQHKPTFFSGIGAFGDNVQTLFFNVSSSADAMTIKLKILPFTINDDFGVNQSVGFTAFNNIDCNNCNVYQKIICAGTIEFTCHAGSSGYSNMGITYSDNVGNQSWSWGAWSGGTQRITFDTITETHYITNCWVAAGRRLGSEAFGCSVKGIK